MVICAYQESPLKGFMYVFSTMAHTYVGNSWSYVLVPVCRIRQAYSVGGKLRLNVIILHCEITEAFPDLSC